MEVEVLAAATAAAAVSVGQQAVEELRGRLALRDVVFSTRRKGNRLHGVDC